MNQPLVLATHSLSLEPVRNHVLSTIHCPLQHKAHVSKTFYLIQPIESTYFKKFVFLTGMFGILEFAQYGKQGIFFLSAHLFQSDRSLQ